MTYVGRDYVPELEKARAQREESLRAIKDDSMNRLLKDLAIDRAQNPASALNDRWDSSEEDEDEGDINIIDRCKGALINSHLACSRTLSHDSGRKRARRVDRCHSGDTSYA